MIDFLNIVGQDQAIAQLQRAMAGGRMPHALLFAGPRGVGRRTTAAALAKVLLCSNAQVGGGLLSPTSDISPALQACGQCADCRMMDSASHPDFHLVYKELARFHESANVRDRVMQELSIDVIESFLITPALRASNRGRGKVFVVQQADLMSTAAQNALLKTLEEPPPGVTIILLCPRGEQMLPTTVSRCRVIHFQLLPRSFVAEHLTKAGLAQPEARFWADFTGGSIGRAGELSRAGLYAVKWEAIARLAQVPPGGDSDLSDFLVKACESQADAAIKAVKAASGAELSKALAMRQSTGAMLELIASAYVDAMHVSANMGDDDSSAQAAVPQVNRDQAEAINAIAHRFRPIQLANIVEQLSEFEQLLWRNVNPKLVWDNVVITCATG